MHIYILQDGSEIKQHKVYGTTVLQPYVTVSCSFQENVQKWIVYTTVSSAWIQQINIFFVLQLASQLFKNNINFYIFIFNANSW